MNHLAHIPRVLVACECSGRVRDAFAAKGFDSWSCDLKPSENVGNHIQGDALDAIRNSLKWDLIIAHPECTHLAVSVALHFKAKRADGRQQEAIQFFMSMVDACNAAGCRWCIENPVGIMSTKWRKPDQIVQPWQFGDPESKKTCLWLEGLPLLKSTKIAPPLGWRTVKFLGDMFDQETEEAIFPDCGVDWAECSCPGPTQDDMEYAEIHGVLFARPIGASGKPVWENQTPSGQNKLGPSADRPTNRSRTYRGIANAMADQWGTLLHTRSQSPSTREGGA